MREIKFRVWDNIRKEIINWDRSEFGLMPFSNLYNKEFREVYTFMQYTGLKDKNGVEIYEGDIIRAKDYLTKDNKKYFDDVGIVEFKDGMFMICDDFPSSFKGQIIEVIGNIYENPELLN